MDKDISDPHHEMKIDIRPDARFWQHARNPSNLGSCEPAHASARGVGSCGDTLWVELRIDHRTIEQVRCRPDGCIYTMACASAMSELAQGRSIDEALDLEPEDVVRELEILPQDHMHCARLAINTLGDAIADYYRKQLVSNPDEVDEPTENGN